jgi:hypothetical protein
MVVAVNPHSSSHTCSETSSPSAVSAPPENEIVKVCVFRAGPPIASVDKPRVNLAWVIASILMISSFTLISTVNPPFHYAAFFCFLTFAHLANTAFRALSLRSSAVMLAALAGPPIFPPLRPNATAAGFFFLVFGMT